MTNGRELTPKELKAVARLGWDVNREKARRLPYGRVIPIIPIKENLLESGAAVQLSDNE